MSDSEDDDQIEEEEDDDVEENEEQDEDDDGDDDDEDEDDEDGDDDDEDGDDQDDQDQEGDQDQDDNQSEIKPVPTFKQIHVPQSVKFQNLLSDISSLSNTVDSFIGSLPSHGGSYSRSYVPRSSYIPPAPKLQPIIDIPQQKNYTVMKDEDIQVSMQPQIVIQQTVTPKQEPKKQPYRISNQSTKFLAQLYQQNKKLKRWQNSHTTQSGFYNSGVFGKSQFERNQHQKGLINIDDHNRQIDEAIQMLRREDYSVSQ